MLTYAALQQVKRNKSVIRSSVEWKPPLFISYDIQHPFRCPVWNALGCRARNAVHSGRALSRDDCDRGRDHRLLGRSRNYRVADHLCRGAGCYRIANWLCPGQRDTALDCQTGAAGEARYARLAAVNCEASSSDHRTHSAFAVVTPDVISSISAMA
jgi:hypothetical protein